MATASRSLHGTAEKESVVRGPHVYKAIWTPVNSERRTINSRPGLYIPSPASIYETQRSDQAFIRDPASF